MAIRRGTAWALFVVTLLAAGCVELGGGPGPTTTSPSVHRPHEHYAFRMFEWNISGASPAYSEIVFSHPGFDYPAAGTIDGHLHLSGRESTGTFQYVIHSESGQVNPGIRLDAFFEGLGLKMEEDFIRLHREYQDGRTLRNDGDRAWNLWVDDCKAGSDDWQDVPWFESYVPITHDRMLIVFQPPAHRATDLQAQFSQVPKHDEMEAALRDSC